MGRPDELVPFDYKKKMPSKHVHARSLNRSLCIPSAMQSYSLATEFVKYWFLSKFPKDAFKSIYVDGKNIYDDFRRVPKVELIKRPKPSLSITPSIQWDFTNDNIENQQFGLDLYQARGLFKDSFFKDRDHQVYLGIGLETLLMNFGFRCRFETRGQQLDAYKFIQMAHRVGNMYGEDVDLDFHIPYALIVQIAEDLGFEVEFNLDNSIYPRIKNIHKFLSYLNTHSAMPFLYKFRAENGKNEFFLRMQRMYININPTDLNADDGEREGQMLNNYTIDMTVEIRFPAPKLYAYYSNNEHKIKTVYSAWAQATGLVTSVYTFKGTPIPDTNSRGWQLWLSTTYEEENLDDPLTIAFSELFEGDLKSYIQECIYQGMSPAIFCDIIMINGGEHPEGKMNWETMTFVSDHPVRNIGTFIGVYLDMEYINNYILCTRDGLDNRMQLTQHPDSYYLKPIKSKDGTGITNQNKLIKK